MADPSTDREGLRSKRDRDQPKISTQNYAQLPLSFEANRGQTDSSVKFFARGPGYGLFLTHQTAVVRLRKSAGRTQIVGGSQSSETGEEEQRATDATITMRFNGSSPTSNPVALNKLPGKSNYFIGNKPQKWRTNISLYSKVQYQNIYRGIDLVYYGNHAELGFDLIVAPGVLPRQIRMSFR